MTPGERRKWWGDDPVEVDGPPIETVLPKLSAVTRVTASFASHDRNEKVEFSIGKANWEALFELLDDSQPVKLGSEILSVGLVKIATENDQTYSVEVLSSFANPIIYVVHNPRVKKTPHFANFDLNQKYWDSSN